jgi:8-oxo-dGTP pyrophosphatase MutT (NUDIX family)
MPQISIETHLEHNHQRPQLSATSILILERSGEECQIFVLKRQNRGGFLKDALIFPGGKLEECDYSKGKDPLLATAVRETQEETGLCLDPSSLTLFSWWMTPKIETRRFDTRFYVGPYPLGQELKICQEEAEWGRLFAPSELLELHKRHEVRLMPPNLLTLEMISGLRTLDEVRARALHLEEPICPELMVDEAGDRYLTIPDTLGLARTRFKIGADGRFS